MKVVFLNQHGANRGDHAAFISQLDYIRKAHSDITSLTIIYNATSKGYPIPKSIDFPVTHILDEQHSVATKLMFRFISLFPMIAFLSGVSNYLSNINRYLKTANKIYLSNGGANIGPYKDWKYLCRLVLAGKYSNEISSFGNSCNTGRSALFDKAAVKALRNFHHYLIRDTVSQEYASQSDIDFTPTLDIVFMRSEALFSEKAVMEGKNYVVFVPNEVYSWHPLFSGRTEYFTHYTNVIDRLTKSGYEVVMLPQLFGDNHINDYNFFCQLREKSSAKDKIHVYPESTTPETQISLIKESNFVIGGRYHSIVFAITSGAPFVSLSYEDKMVGMLRQLDLSRYDIPLSDFSLERLESQIDYIENNRDKIAEEVCAAADSAQATVDHALSDL